jgi:hypothetical protein
MANEFIDINSVLSKRLELSELTVCDLRKKLNIAIEGLNFIVNSRDHLDIAKKTLIEIGEIEE